MIFGIDGNEILHGERAIRRYTINLIRELCADPGGDIYKVLYFRFRKPNYPKIELPAHPHIREKTIYFPGKIIKHLWESIRFPDAAAMIGKADIFHVPGVFIPPRGKIPMIATIHSMHHKTIPHLIEKYYLEWFCKFDARMVRECDYFIAVSESMRSDFQAEHRLPEDRVVTIPLGLSPEFYPRDKARARGHVKERFHIDRPYILYVGGIQRHKNVPNILEAFKCLKTRPGVSDLLLVLAGDQPPGAHEIIRQKSELGLDDSVLFTGYIEQETEDLAWLYSAAEVFVFPSYYEGWASPPLEAMASGLPVVASKIPSLKESCRDAAVFVDPDSPDEIAEALHSFLTDAKLRENYRSRGLDRVKSLTWKGMADATREFYRRCAE